MIEARPARQSDILAFFERLPPRAVRAWVLERNGEVLGVAGYHVIDGMAVVFSDAKPGISNVRIWRESVAFMNDLKIPAICTASEGSGPFLERLGWEYAGPSSTGDIYKFDPAGHINE